MELNAHYFCFQDGIRVVNHAAQRFHKRRDITGHARELNHLIMRIVRRLIKHHRASQPLYSQLEQSRARFVYGISNSIVAYVSHNASLAVIILPYRLGDSMRPRKAFKLRARQAPRLLERYLVKLR